ncbi:hypothetical protein BGZ94_000887 [Podila epigama]|nr:hypothetical protein BGZ94_000887 [Podila epigama]
MASFGSPITRDGPGTVRRRDIILSAREKQVYGQLWAAADKDNSGFITGADAVPFFAKSGLSPSVLSQIWVLADTDNKGVLGQQGFSIAVKLIAHAQNGKAPSAALINIDAPLPHFEGITPAKTGDSSTAPSLATGAEPIVTNEDRAKYGAMFLSCGPVNGLLDGDKAREVFLKSKLPVEKLSQIWNLADTKERGSLDITDFTIAMYYIQHTMDNSISTLPATLPPSVLKACTGPNANSSILASPVMTAQTLSRQMTGNNINIHNPVVARQLTGSMSMNSSPLAKQHTGVSNQFGALSASTDIPWEITPEEKAKFDRFFDQLDPNGTGVVGGEEASRFFMNSRLPEPVLAQIWDLSDITGSGSLSKDEFAVAMLLINRKNASNAPIPKTLPLSLIPPSLRGRSTGLSFNQQEPVRSATMPSVSQQYRRQSFDLLGDGPVSSSVGGISGSTHGGDNDLIGAEDLTSKITSETGELASMQNQINNLSKVTGDLQAKRAVLEKNLSALSAQKQDFSIRLNQIKTLHENETKTIKDLENALSTIQPQLIKLREELVVSERELAIARKNKDDFLLTLARDQEENNQIKIRLRQNNEETIRLREELEAKKKDTGRQKGLLEIARRQMAASDADKQKLVNEIEQEAAKAAQMAQEIQALSSASAPFSDVSSSSILSAPAAPMTASGPPPPPAPRGSRKEPPPPPASRGSNNSTPISPFASRVSPEAEEAFGIPPALRSPTGSFHSVTSPRMMAAAATATTPGALSRQSTGSTPFDIISREHTGSTPFEPIAHQGTGSSSAFETIPRQSTGMSAKAPSVHSVSESVNSNSNNNNITNAFLNAPNSVAAAGGQDALWSPLTHAAHAAQVGQPEVTMSPEPESIPAPALAAALEVPTSNSSLASQDPFGSMAFPAMDTPPVTKMDFDAAFSNFSVSKPSSQSKLDSVKSAEDFAQAFPDIDAVTGSDDTKSKRVSAFGFDDDFSASSPFGQTLSTSKEDDEFPPIVELNNPDEDSSDDSDDENEDAFVQAKSSIPSPEPTVDGPSVKATVPEAQSSSTLTSSFEPAVAAGETSSSTSAPAPAPSVAPAASATPVEPSVTGSSTTKKLTAADFSEFETSFGGGDDFDSAFNGVELTAPKVSNKIAGFDDGFDFNASFDDAFGASSSKPAAPVSGTNTSGGGGQSFGATFSSPFGDDGFGNMSFQGAGGSSSKPGIDLDEAFGGLGGGSAQPSGGKQAGGGGGFGNAFGDFEQQFTAQTTPAAATRPVPAAPLPTAAAAPVDGLPTPVDLPGVEELMNMGFTRQQSNDALSRYDTVERAANFLLEGGGQ